MKEVYDPELLGLQVAKLMGDEVLVYCPFHNDKKPSAEYHLTKGLFYCFGCQSSKTARQLAKELGGTLVPVSISSVVDEKRLEGDLIDDWINLIKNPLAHGNEYLKSRQVYNHSINQFDIRQNSDGVIFPIRNREGNIVGAQIRHYRKTPKYKIYGTKQPAWPMENLFFPGLIAITEGVFGTIRCNDFGNINSVSSMGAGSSDKTARFLKKNGMLKPVGIMDTDFAGYLASGKMVLNEVPVLDYPKAWGDPDEWSKEKWGKVSKKLTNDFDKVTTLNVNKIIEKSKEPFKLEEILRKYWRKLNE